MRSRRRAFVGAALVGAVVTALAGCSGGWNPGAGKAKASSSASKAAPASRAPSSSVPTSVPPATTAVPAKLSWSGCGSIDGTSSADQCATLPVPLDRNDAAGSQVLLQLARRPATDQAHKVGSLLINPGGPGESTVGEFDGLVNLLSTTLQKRFDIIGWDPRGTGRSAPVHCVDGPTMDKLVASSPDPSTAAGLARFTSDVQTYVGGCAQKSGGLLAHVGTLDTAKDMDAIRASLGEDQLSYLGFSYGTELGMTYASLFPSRVRAFVLDGALDPKVDPLTVSEQQSVGFEANLDAFFTWCKQQGDDCPWKTDDPGTAYDYLLNQVRKNPPAVGSRKLTPNLFVSAVVLELYDQSTWEQLALALNNLGRGNPALMMALSDEFYDRDQNGNYGNTYDAFTAISCLDQAWPTDVAPYVASYQRSQAKAPRVVGGYVNAVGPGYSCALWPAKVTTPLPTSVTGAGPIIIVGTTNDPATPFSNAVGMQQEITGSYLVERRGNGHTGYGASACVRSYADNYLIDPTHLPSARHVVCNP